MYPDDMIEKGGFMYRESQKPQIPKAANRVAQSTQGSTRNLRLRRDQRFIPKYEWWGTIYCNSLVVLLDEFLNVIL